jgi:uncharacterized protein (TIGR03083 family)
MRTLEALYAEGRDRIVELVAGADPAAVDGEVPACPAWSVHDVVSHLTGVGADVLAGNIAGAATDEWTDAQIQARRGRSTADVIAEWHTVGPQLAALLDDFPEPYGRQVVADLAVHEHDIRGALDEPAARASAGVGVGLEFLRGELVAPAVDTLGLSPLDRVLSVDEFELFRALSGRRSAKQIRRFDWNADPDAYLPLFSQGPFTVRPTDLVE